MCVFCLQIPLGFGIGCNVRIAQLLGAGDVARTKLNAKIAVAMNGEPGLFGGQLCLIKYRRGSEEFWMHNNPNPATNLKL
jgi:Na+-driven multidrug efflux pump